MRLEREEEKEIREKDEHLRRSEEVRQPALQPRQAAFNNRHLDHAIPLFRPGQAQAATCVRAPGRCPGSLERVNTAATVERVREEDLDEVEGWHCSPKLALDMGRTGTCPHAHSRSVD